MIKLLIEEIQNRISKNQQVILAIDGSAGSGKSTLALKLKDFFNGSLIKCDDFFLPINKRTDNRLSEIGGNIDYERMKVEVIDKLGTDFYYNAYDCSINTFNNTVRVNNNLLIIIEGVYALHPYFGKYYNLSVFLTINEEIQKQRIIERNGEILYQKFKNEWIPRENLYFAKTDILNKVDFIIKND